MANAAGTATLPDFIEVYEGLLDPAWCEGGGCARSLLD